MSDKIDRLLESVTGSLGRLDELERDYKEQRAATVAELSACVEQLAVLSGSQAERARVIRDLYWHKRISAEIIGAAFKVQVGRIRTIAGKLTLEVPCNRGCGGRVKKTYSSRAEQEAEQQSKRRADKSRLKGISLGFGGDICDACAAAERNESAAEYARLRSAERARSEALRSMGWADFIRTREWVSTRNSLLHQVDYRCEICQTSGVDLFIYPHKDTPQDYPFSFRSRRDNESRPVYSYFVLCAACVHRCHDLIVSERYERVRAERLPEIIDAYMRH